MKYKKWWNNNKITQAGAKLCQAKAELGQAKMEIPFNLIENLGHLSLKIIEVIVDLKWNRARLPFALKIEVIYHLPIKLWSSPESSCLQT